MYRRESTLQKVTSGPLVWHCGKSFHFVVTLPIPPWAIRKSSTIYAEYPCWMKGLPLSHQQNPLDAPETSTSSCPTPGGGKTGTGQHSGKSIPSWHGGTQTFLLPSQLSLSKSAHFGMLISPCSHHPSSKTEFHQLLIHPCPSPTWATHSHCDTH